MFDTGRTAELSALRVGHIPGLLNVDRRNRSFENFQGLYQDLNPEPQPTVPLLTPPPLPTLEDTVNLLFCVYVCERDNNVPHLLL
jgi:hypothetical protein